MPTIFKKIENSVNLLPQKYDLLKLNYLENRAILDKRDLFSSVKWTTEQQMEFDNFWTEHYGKKIRSYWNKLYESFNGIYRYDYFPEILFTTKVEPLLNPMRYCDAVNDKSLLDLLYDNIADVRIPKTYLVNCNGVFLSKNRNILSNSKAADEIYDVGECVIKPTIDTGSGKNVLFLDLANGYDKKTGKAISEILLQYDKNYIVQEAITSSKHLKKLYPSSINTIRYITYIVDDEIHSAPASLRIGVNGNKLDNIHLGAISVHIKKDGNLDNTGYQLNYGNQKVVFDSHPDTNVIFKDTFACDIEKVNYIACKLHANTPYLGVISWDFAIDNDDNVVLIEANCRDQGVWFPQILSGEPLFGKDTPYIMELISKKK